MDRNENMANAADDVLLIKGLATLRLDVTGHIRAWSDAAAALFGYGREDVLGRTMSFLSPPEDADAGMDIDELGQAASSGHVEAERWRVRRDGTRIWIASSLSALTGKTGEPDGFLVILADRGTARSRITALEKRVATLELWHKEKDTLAYRISHAMRNSLAPLKNVSFVLKQKSTNPELSFPLGMIDRQLDVMGRLVEDLARVTRIDTGDVLIDSKPFHLSKLIQRILDWKKSEFAQKSQAVTCLMPPHDVVMNGDEAQLERALTQLLDNAFKFTPADGTIGIELSTDDRNATIRIRDSGEGLNAKLLPRITRFLTMPRADSHPYVPGAGLSTAKDLVEAHQGMIDVHSDGDGKGSEFTIRLPLAG